MRRWLAWERRAGGRMWRFILRVHAGWVYLAGSERAVQARPAELYQRPCLPLLLAALGWGVFSGLVWQLVNVISWRYLHEYTAPAAAVAALTFLFPLRPAAMELSTLLLGRRRFVRLGGLVVLAGLYWLLLRQSWRYHHDYANWLPPRWDWLWPMETYRLLVLAPLWGAWGIVVLGQFYRPSAQTDRATASLAGRLHPLAVAACLLAPLAASLACLRFLGPCHLVPPAAALAAIFGGGSLLAVFRPPLRRAVLLSTGLLAQLAFLAAYVAVR
jgi:hypothetical protein